MKSSVEPYGESRERILLGGVPFGCNNVGDEAILECAVRLLRDLWPDAAITVSTADGDGTAGRLNVDTCPLFGFTRPIDRPALDRVLRGHDIYIWCGATGLSDYPEVSLQLLEAAQAAGCTTIVLGVGMNDELNPFLYRVMPGRRKTALTFLRALTLGSIDTVRLEERRFERRARRKIRRYLSRADLVVVRDPESKEQLRACGVSREIVVGADIALTLHPRPWEELELPEPVAVALADTTRPRVGLCISAQRQVQQRDQLVAYLDRLVAERNAWIVFLPMDPHADAEVMRALQRDMAHGEHGVLVSGVSEPAEVAGIAAALDLVVSSRLHLLIFTSISHVPFIGISRGSKVLNFCDPYGVRCPGSTEACDFDALWAESQRWLDGPVEFEAQSRRVRDEQLERIAGERRQLEATVKHARDTPMVEAGARG